MPLSITTPWILRWWRRYSTTKSGRSIVRRARGVFGGTNEYSPPLVGQCRDHTQDLALEVDGFPLQRQDLAESHSGP
jgi:hypothetical protein